MDMDFTRDGGKLVLSHGEVWDTKSSRLEASVADRQTDQVVIGDDGREFLLVSEGGGTLWSPPGRIARFSIQGIALGSQMISPSNGELKVCYHPQDQVLGSSANGLRLWDLHTSAPITRNFEVLGHRRGKLPIFFSPNGSRLYSIGDKLAVFNYQQLTKNVQPDQNLEAWSKILSGKRIDSLGGLVGLTKQEYEQSWKIIQGARTAITSSDPPK
jgi:WD40 repeat protein